MATGGARMNAAMYVIVATAISGNMSTPKPSYVQSVVSAKNKASYKTPPCASKVYLIGYVLHVLGVTVANKICCSLIGPIRYGIQVMISS
jgi:hypothetical protein